MAWPPSASTTRIAASAAQCRHTWCSRRWSATPEGAQPADTRRGGEVRQPTCRRWLLCFIPIHSVTSTDSPPNYWVRRPDPPGSHWPCRWTSTAPGDHYVLHADLPGVDPDSVDVSIDGGVLTVTAQRSERTEHDVQWLNSERFTGGYMRRLSLGQDIDADHIAATYQNGVLTVTLPVAARAEPRHIEITPGAREETKVIEPSDSSDQHTTT